MKPRRSTTSCRSLLPCFGVALAMTQLAAAGSRHFTYSYETTTMAKGAMELENSVTWKTQKAENPGFDGFDFRHEFEYGFSDRLQLAFYFADWSHQKSDAEPAKSKFQDVAVEAIYNLTDPNTHPFGSALYGEIKGSDDFIELESKLLLQKNLGSWMFVYNVGGEIVWEDDYKNDNAELKQSAGVSYQCSPSWSMGAEVLHEIAVPGVDTIGASGVFFGPNLAWQHQSVSLTMTGLWQLTALDGEPDFQLRTIFSVNF